MERVPNILPHILHWTDGGPDGVDGVDVGVGGIVGAKAFIGDLGCKIKR